MADAEGQTFASVWDAIEASPEQAARWRLRSDLLIAIKQAVAAWRTTPTLAADRLGVTRSERDDVLHSPSDALDLDRLVGLADRAGISIRLEPVGAAA